LSVCVSVGHVREACENGRTDRDAVWGLGRVGERNKRGPVLQKEGGNFGRSSAPVKSNGRLCCGVRKNDRTDRDDDDDAE